MYHLTLGMVMCALNSTLEVQAGGTLRASGQPGLHGEFEDIQGYTGRLPQKP